MQTMPECASTTRVIIKRKNFSAGCDCFMRFPQKIKHMGQIGLQEFRGCRSMSKARNRNFESQNEPDDVKGNPDHRCPDCSSEAVYRYGRTKNAKQRFLCLVCGRQFVRGSRRHDMKNRPECPACGKKMHLYKKEPSLIRFRCADYPQCRTFIKLKTKEER